MDYTDLDKLCAKFLELKKEADEIKNNLDLTKSLILEKVGNNEQISSDKFIIKNTISTQIRFDSKKFALETVYKDVYNKFLKSTTTTRFSVVENKGE